MKPVWWVVVRHVPGTGFWNGASTLNQYFVLPMNGSKYYLKYTFLVFPVLGILGLGTSLIVTIYLWGFIGGSNDFAMNVERCIPITIGAHAVVWWSARSRC